VKLRRRTSQKFIPTWGSISNLDSKWIEVENTEVEVTHVTNSGLYLLNSKAILRTASRIEEQVFNLRSMRQVLNESNNYIGNRAYINMDDILGVSVLMKRMLKAAKSIAQNGSPIMLLGEKFTGRETLAQAIHNKSSRASFGFVRVDVSSLPAEKLEETLWGYNENHQPHLKRIPRPGAFEFANGGTLYINEIGLMPRLVQDKIFEVMKTGKISRLGSDISTRVDVRIICSSSMDLSHRIEKNEFRIDLFYALSPVSLRVPPLRERRPDIALLLDHYLNIKARELGLKKPSIPKKIMLILRRYEWPENFRELIELSERILIDQGEMFKNFKNERDFKRRHLYLEHLKAVESVITLEDHEKKLVLKAYNAFDGSISKASRALGISRNTLYLKLKKYGVEV
jgi:sigma-54 dependent transcriptional regulator, acetoin dehydrogenase operon transcriptional activator AcoR